MKSEMLPNLNVETKEQIDDIWISWEKHRRNVGLSNALGCPLFEIDIKGNRWIRYLKSIRYTYRVIISFKPRIVIVQNPSIVLVLTSMFLRILFKYKLVVDAHNAGLFPSEGKYNILMIIAKWIQKYSDLTVVTNSLLKCIVEENEGRVSILPDKLPECPETITTNEIGGPSVLFICTFAADEPYLEVIEAARMVNSNISIYITGKYENKINVCDMPENIHLLGFVSEDYYWKMLHSVDVIMDLTKRDGCLVCGAYEAVSVEKPLILSDTRALRGYFYKGCVYVDNSPKEIASGILESLRRTEFMTREIKDLKVEIANIWEQQLCDFKILLGLT